MKFDRHKFFEGFRDKIDESIEQEQVDGLEFLLKGFETDPHWKDYRHIAYALATTYHETAGSFQPVEEGYYLGSATRVKNFQKTLRYYPYFGRGYVQLTWETKRIPNYSKASKALGIDFVKKPELVMVPENAFKILTLGMFEGWFTSKKLSDYISDTGKDYKNARKIINGLDKAALIAGYANQFEAILRAAKTPATATATNKPIENSIKGISETADSQAGQSLDFEGERPTNGSSVKVEITPEGGVKAETSDKPPEPPTPKERIAVVKTKPKGYFTGIGAKIASIVTGNSVFQFAWAQIEKFQDWKVPMWVWFTVSGLVVGGSLIWIMTEIMENRQENRRQKELDELLVKENSTSDNLVQLIPHDEVDLYRTKKFKIITRGE